MTGMYLIDITNTFFVIFAFECELSEFLLFVCILCLPVPPVPSRIIIYFVKWMLIKFTDQKECVCVCVRAHLICIYT